MRFRIVRIILRADSLAGPWAGHWDKGLTDDDSSIAREETQVGYLSLTLLLGLEHVPICSLTSDCHRPSSHRRNRPRCF